MKTPRIERYFRPETKDDAIIALGQSMQTQSRPAFGKHTHDCLEICLITKGSIEHFTANHCLTLNANSIQINHPNTIHGLPGSRLPPCTLTWIQVDTDQLHDHELRTDLRRLPESLPQGAIELLPHLEAMITECRHPQRDSTRLVTANLLGFLGKLIRIAARRKPTTHPTTLERALRHISKSADGSVSVSALAATLHTHRTHLHQLFIRHLGVSPQTYLNEQRLHRACQLLTQSSHSVTEIAYRLKFSSSQHLATSFKHRYGQSPSSFRKQNLL